MMRYLLLIGTTLVFLCGNILAQNQAGEAVSLDGDGDYVVFLSNIINTTTFTIEAWAKMNGQGGGSVSENPLFEQRDDAVGGSDKSTIIFNTERDNGNTALRIRSSIGFVDSVEYTSPNYNEWHHYAGVVYSETIYLYIDGILVDSASNTQTGNYITSIDYVDIGRHRFAGQNGGFFYGLIDEFRAWNLPRTQVQIQSTMNDTLGAEYYSTSDSGLVAYLRFDELEDLGINGDGPDDVRDFSVNGIHGDLVGGATLDTSGALVGIEEEVTQIPTKFLLSQNYPNPFNPSTKISYSLPKTGFVRLKIYDMLGREVQTLVNEFQSIGYYTTDFDADKLSSGIYLYRLQMGNFTATKKMLLLR